MPIKLFVRAAEQFRSQFQQFVYRNFFPQHLQLAYTGNHFDLDRSETSTSIFEDNIWFAGPKSKISPGRKREKHRRFFPKRVLWNKCEKCGEAKVPHRICTKHLDICAMRPKDWEIYKKSNPVPVAQKSQEE